MDRRRLLKVAGATAVTGAVSAPAIAQSAPTIKWRLTTTFPKTLDTLYGACDLLAKTVADLSDQKFQITVHGPGEIVPPFQVFDAVANNTVEMGNTASYYYIGKDLAFAFGTAVPFGLNTRQMNSWLAYGGGLDLLNELYGTFGMMAIPFGNTTAQMGGWFRKEIKTIDDLVGPEIPRRRHGGHGAEQARRGAAAIAARAISILRWRKGRSTPPNGSAPMTTRSSASSRSRLTTITPAGGKAAPTASSTSTWRSGTNCRSPISPWSRRHARWPPATSPPNTTPTTRGRSRRLVANGAQLRPFSPEILDASFKATNELYAEIGAKNERFKKLHDSMMAFRLEQYQWDQVCEATYDNYMIRKLRG